MYKGPEGLDKGKGQKTVSRAGARRLRQLSSPDVPSPVRHVRMPINLIPFGMASPTPCDQVYPLLELLDGHIHSRRGLARA